MCIYYFLDIIDQVVERGTLNGHYGVTSFVIGNTFSAILNTYFGWRYPLQFFAFHRYAYQGLFNNEFEGLRFANINGIGGASSNNDKYISGEKYKW